MKRFVVFYLFRHILVKNTFSAICGCKKKKSYNESI